MKKIQYASFICLLFLVATESILHGAAQRYDPISLHDSKKLFGATNYNSSFDKGSLNYQYDLWPEERDSGSTRGHHTSSSRAFPETQYIKIGNRLIGRTQTSEQKLEKEKEKKREKKKRNKQNQRERAQLLTKIEQELLKVRQGNRILMIKKEDTQHALEKSMAEIRPLTPPVLPDFDRLLPTMQKAVNISLHSFSIPSILAIPDLSSPENMQSLAIFINNASQNNVLQENKQAYMTGLAVCWATEHCLSGAFEKLKVKKISQEQKQGQEKNVLELPLSSNTATSNITVGQKNNLTTVTKKNPNSENSNNDLLNIDFPESDHESDQDTQPGSPISESDLSNQKEELSKDDEIEQALRLAHIMCNSSKISNPKSHPKIQSNLNRSGNNSNRPARPSLKKKPEINDQQVVAMAIAALEKKKNSAPQSNQQALNKKIKKKTPFSEQSEQKDILQKCDLVAVAEKLAIEIVLSHAEDANENSTSATFLDDEYFCNYFEIPDFDDPDTRRSINYFLQKEQLNEKDPELFVPTAELIERWVNEKFIPDQQIKIKKQQEKKREERKEQEEEQRQLLEQERQQLLQQHQLQLQEQRQLQEQKKRQQDAEEKENKSAQLVITMQQLEAEPKNSPKHAIYFEKFRTLFYGNYKLVGTDVERHTSLLNSLIRKYRLGHNAWKPERVKQSSAADRTLAKPKKNKPKQGNGNKIATSTHSRKQDISKSTQKLADTIIATRNRLKQNSKFAQFLSAEAEAKVCAEDYALFRWGLTNVPLEQPAPEPALSPESTEEETKNAAQALATQSYIMRHGGLTITVDPHTKKHHVFNDLRYDTGQIDERYDDGCYRIGNTTFFPSTMKEEDLLERIGRAIEENGIPFTDSKGNTIIVAKLPQNPGDSGPSVLHRIHILVVMQKKNPGTIKTYYRIPPKTHDRLCLKAQNNQE